MSDAIYLLIDAAQKAAALALAQVAGRASGNRERIALLRVLVDDALLTGAIAQGIAAGWRTETCEARVLALRADALAMLRWRDTLPPLACPETYVCGRLNDALHSVIIEAERLSLPTSGAAHRDSRRVALFRSQSGRVELFEHCQAAVAGKEKTLTPARYAVIRALIENGPLSGRALNKAAGKGDARKNLLPLLADSDWSAVIVRPGVKGGRYAIR